MTEREAMQLALNVLETTWGHGNENAMRQWEKAIEALEQVLEQPERTWVGFTEEEFIFWCNYCRAEYLADIEKALMEKNT